MNAWGAAFGSGGGWGSVNLGALVPKPEPTPKPIDNETKEKVQPNEETKNQDT